MIRKLQAKDKDQLVSIIDGTDNFTFEEKKVAVELIDEAINSRDQEYYNFYVYEDNFKIVGYYCIGKRALTDGVFDIYWIVVDSIIQNKGIGKQLLNHAESFAIENNGSLVLAETSSKENYNATRNFYLRNKYSIVSQIKNFYTLNDNLIVFGKYIKI
jgi:aminoglycoside 6'-N-acetyltransferase I